MLKADSISIWRRLLDFYLYCNIHISLGAVALCYFSSILVGYHIEVMYYFFVFCSTLLLYSIHRIYGLSKVEGNLDLRYQTIQSLGIALKIIIGLAFLGSTISYFTLPIYVKVMLILPAVISAGYALPVWKGKRIRDYNFLKIFLVAIIWTLVVSIIPGTIDMVPERSIWLASAMICSYMFAITIPFDVRDLHIDQGMHVKTIPAQFGVNNSILTSVCLLTFGSCIAIYIGYFKQLDATFCILPLGLLSLAVLIWTCRNAKSDYYYTGVLDGTMILLGVWALLY